MESGKLIKVEALPRESEYVQEQIIEVLRKLANNPGALERVLRCADRIPDLERHMSSFEDRCRSTVTRCETLEMMCRTYVCPGNVNYSQRTLDEYSGLNPQRSPRTKWKRPVDPEGGVGGPWKPNFDTCVQRA